MGRGAGFAVLAAAAVLVAAAALRPSPLDGAASPIDIPGPPAVGDCVTERWSAPWAAYQPELPLFANYGQMTTAPCSSERFGEVAAVILDPQRPGPVDSSTDSGYVDPNMDRCAEAGHAYLGTATPATHDGVAWLPSLMFTWPIVSSPSDLQLAGGQRWLACIVSSGGGGDGDDPYDISLRDAVVTGVERDATGLCTDRADLQAGYTNDACGRPHTTQLLAQAPTPDTATPMARLRDSCAAAAASLTGLTDPTARGALTVVVVASGPSGRGTADPVPPDSWLQCALTTTDPSRTLSGGLMGLGDAPIPWT